MSKPFANYAFRRSRFGDRIGVPMDELPGPVLGPEDAGHSQGHRGDFLTPSDLRLEPLDPRDVREVRCYAPCYFLELDRSAVAVIRSGPASGLSNLTRAADGRAKGVREGRVFPWLYSSKKPSGLPSAISSSARWLASTAWSKASDAGTRPPPCPPSDRHGVAVAACSGSIHPPLQC